MTEIAIILGWALVLVVDALLAAGGSAIKNSSQAQIRQLEHEDRGGARLVRRVAEHTTRLILSLRLGKSVLRLLALGLAVKGYFDLTLESGGMTFGGVVAVVLGTWLVEGLITYAAENLALRDPSAWSISLAPVVAAATSVFAPVVWFLSRLSSWIARSDGERSFPLVTEEEIMTMVEAGEEGGVIEQDEREMIFSIFQLGDTLAREVMVPRIDLLAFEEHVSLVEATETLLQTGYSRAPVYSGGIDNVIGLVYIKDLLAAWSKGKQDQQVGGLVREAYFVPEAKKVDDLLGEMQARRVQMAVVVDEYGGTAGVVTFEDIVEEIFGEIQDEYDTAEEKPYHEVREGEYLFRGRMDLDDLRQITGVSLPKESSETLGGFIYGQLGRVPTVGEVVEAGGLRMTVEQVAGRRIRKVRVCRKEISDEQGADANANGTIKPAKR